MRDAHPVFNRDIPSYAPVWRYFDFAKFSAFLQRRALYFSRSDLLGDPLEGSFTQAYAAQRDEMIKNPPEGRTRHDLEDVFRYNERIFAATARSGYVNCWHLGDHESMAMWRGYGGSYGVAIRTTFERLDRAVPVSFQGSELEEPIFIGKVNYIDYSSLTERLPHEFNIYGQLMCKSVAYQHENEVRVIFTDVPAQFQRSVSPAGYDIPVDIEDLVETIVVSPLAPSWFADVVERAYSSQGLTFRLARSIAAVSPVH